MQTFSFTILHGKVTSEPETITFNNGQKQVNFSLCLKNKTVSDDVNKIYEFFTIKAGPKLAELAKNRIKKGEFVEVVGQLKQERWSKNEQRFSRIVINADRLGFLSYEKKQPQSA
jgi:single stranded DNA-binding protein